MTLKMKVQKLLSGSYIATAKIDGMNYVGFGDSHYTAIQDAIIKHHNNVNK